MGSYRIVRGPTALPGNGPAQVDVGGDEGQSGGGRPDGEQAGVVVNRGRNGVAHYPHPAKRYDCVNCGKLVAVGDFTGWIQPACPHCGKPQDLREPNAN